MEIIRVAGVDDIPQKGKSAEFHLYMNAILPKAQQYVEEKLQLRKLIRKWAATGIIGFIGVIVLLIQKPRSSALESLFPVLLPGLILLIIAAAVVGFLKYKQYQELSIETGLERIGQFPLNIAIHNTEIGTAVVDEDEVFEPVEFNYQQLNNFEEVKSAYNNYLDATNSLPAILSPVHKDQEIQTEESEGLQKAMIFDDEEKIRSAHSNIKEAYQSINETSVKQYLLKKDSPFVIYLQEHEFEYDGKALQPSEKTSKTLEKVMGIVESRSTEDETADIDDWSHNLYRKLAEDALKLSHIRDNILTKVMGSIFPRLSNIHNFPAHEFFCPSCHKEQLETLLEEDFNAFSDEQIQAVSWDENAIVELVDWENAVWRCKTCERETGNPIPVHKMYKDVLYPAYDSLLLENEIERLKIYSELKDKKIQYKQDAEREIEEINRDNRRNLDEQVFKLNALESQVLSTKRTIDTMQHLLVTVEAVSREKIEAIDEYANNIQRQILEKNKRIEEVVQKEVEENIRLTDKAMSSFTRQSQKEKQEQMKVFVSIAQSQKRQEEMQK